MTQKFPFNIKPYDKDTWLLEIDVLDFNSGRGIYGLNDVGVHMIFIGLAAMPVYCSGCRFWKYNGAGTTKAQPNNVPSVGDSVVTFLSPDKKALEAMADCICDPRCWGTKEEIDLIDQNVTMRSHMNISQQIQ